MRRLIATVFLFLLSCGVVSAQYNPTASNYSIFLQSPHAFVAQIQGTAPIPGTLFTAGAKGSVCRSLTVTNASGLGSAIQMQLTYTPSGSSTANLINGADIPVNAGVYTVSNYDWLNQIPGLPVDSFGNHMFLLNAGDKLGWALFTSVTTGYMYVYGVCYDF